MGARITSHTELEVFQQAFETAMQIFEMTFTFPKEETYSLTDQIRRSSRSVCDNIAEAWRKRRYEAAFVAKLNDAEAEAAETQVWLAFAHRCRYISEEQRALLHELYEGCTRMLVAMIHNPTPWLVRPRQSGR
ncbi:MAG: four helix bundle protein [Armatimonadota bacterium]